MPPDSRSVPRSSRVRSVTLATVSRTSWNTRCPSCTSASAAGVIRTWRPTRRNSGSPSSSSSSAIWRLMADCETWSLRPQRGERPGLSDGLQDLKLAQVHPAFLKLHPCGLGPEERDDGDAEHDRERHAGHRACRS